MTLIGIATYGNRAEFIVDTLNYSSTARQVMHECKFRILHHLGAAVIWHGSSDNAAPGHLVAEALSQQVRTFDELVERMPAGCQTYAQATGHDSEVEVLLYLIGRASSGTYRAVALHSSRGYQPEEIGEPIVLPSPWSLAPSSLELAQVHTVWPLEAEERTRLAAAWSNRPAFQAPRSPVEWIRVAKAARSERALEPVLQRRIPLGGAVHHVKLTPTGATEQVLHRFHDRGPEARQMMAGTFHPLAQATPCPCESGAAYRDCCLAAYYEDGHTCDCGSGKAWEDCCRVSDLDAVPDELWTGPVVQ